VASSKGYQQVYCLRLAGDMQQDGHGKEICPLYPKQALAGTTTHCLREWMYNPEHTRLTYGGTQRPDHGQLCNLKLLPV
jgi:hypothetical protein